MNNKNSALIMAGGVGHRFCPKANILVALSDSVILRKDLYVEVVETELELARLTLACGLSCKH